MITSIQLEYFKTIIDKYYSKTIFPKQDAWKQWNVDEAWLRFVSQVAVVGNSDSEKKIRNNPNIRALLEVNFLKSVEDTLLLSQIINKALKYAGVRYVSNNPTSRKSDACMRNFIFLTKTEESPVTYLKKISQINNEYQRIRQVMTDFSYIKSKGSRDFLITAGLAKQVIALDSRLTKIFKNVGIIINDDYKSSEKAYRELELFILINICQPLSISGAELDRVLYQFYDNL